MSPVVLSSCRPSWHSTRLVHVCAPTSTDTAIVRVPWFLPCLVMEPAKVTRASIPQPWQFSGNGSTVLVVSSLAAQVSKYKYPWLDRSIELPPKDPTFMSMDSPPPPQRENCRSGGTVRRSHHNNYYIHVHVRSFCLLVRRIWYVLRTIISECHVEKIGFIQSAMTCVF